MKRKLAWESVTTQPVSTPRHLRAESLEPGLKGQYADRAVALLGEARALGYFDDPKHVAQAKSKGALDPLRQREDFKKLLAELEARETK